MKEVCLDIEPYAASSVFPGNAGDRAIVHRFLDQFFGGSSRVKNPRFMLGNHMEYSRANTGTGFTTDTGIFVEMWNSWHGLAFLIIKV